MSVITIDGIDELSNFLKNHPKELDKSVIQSLSKGARTINKTIVERLPDRLKKFKSIVTTKILAKSSNPTVLAGIFGRKILYINRRGVKWDSFMLLYWANYGTMANRDNSHIFNTSRRSKTRIFNGGIKPLGFFEKAIDSSYGEALNIAEADLGKTLDIVSSKYGFK